MYTYISPNNFLVEKEITAKRIYKNTNAYGHEYYFNLTADIKQFSLIFISAIQVN